MKYKFRYFEQRLDEGAIYCDRHSPEFDSDGGFATALVRFLAWLNARNNEDPGAKYWSDPNDQLPIQE